MKKLFFIAVMVAAALTSCTKEDEVKPTPQHEANSTHGIDYFTEMNLSGTWTRYRERIQGVYFHVDQELPEVPIPVTLTYWYSPGNHLSFADNVMTIQYYTCLGSDNTWEINWGDPDAFTLSNVVDTGTYAGTSLIEYYKRVN